MLAVRNHRIAVGDVSGKTIARQGGAGEMIQVAEGCSRIVHDLQARGIRGELRPLRSKVLAHAVSPLLAARDTPPL